MVSHRTRGLCLRLKPSLGGFIKPLCLGGLPKTSSSFVRHTYKHSFCLLIWGVIHKALTPGVLYKYICTHAHAHFGFVSIDMGECLTKSLGFTKHQCFEGLHKVYSFVYCCLTYPRTARRSSSSE